jgi:hypothetical protein
MLAALCLAMVFTISLASYISLCYTTLNISTNAVAMGRGTELAEAGIEEALYALNNNKWSAWTLSGGTASATMTMTASGLSTSSSATPLNYGNGMNGTVTVTVQNYATSPSITSQGTITLPAYAGGSTASTQSSTLSYSAPTLGTTNAPVFVNAVAATSGYVRFRSGGTVDSYNSVSGGGYQNYSASIAGYSAVIVSQETAATSATVRLGNAVVQGYASGYDYQSPSSTNWLSYGSSGGLIGPSAASTNTIDSTRLLTNQAPYQPLVSENLPTSWISLPGSASTDGWTLNRTCTLGNSNVSTPTVYDAANGVNLTGGTVVTITGPVVLICYGNVNISGALSQIVLSTPASSLEIFLEYGNLTLGGGGIANTNAIPLPKKLAIIDTNNNWASATISTNTPYYGVIYLPYMTLSVTATSPTFCGSIVASQVSFTNSPTIHYDLALRTPEPGYLKTNQQLSGAAFDYLNPVSTFSGITASVQ